MAQRDDDFFLHVDICKGMYFRLGKAPSLATRFYFCKEEEGAFGGCVEGGKVESLDSLGLRSDKEWCIVILLQINNQSGD